MTRLVEALKEAGQTFELFQRGEIGLCDNAPSAVPVPNLVPSAYCRIPGVAPPPGDEEIDDRCKGVPPSAPRELTYTQQDVIDDHISIPAQYSLVRLSKNPETSADAVGMLEAVKSRQLEGIYCVNWQKSAQRALKLESNWWTVIPEGEDAVLMLDLEDLPHGLPMIAFRNRLHNACGDNNGNLLPDGDARLDAALMSTWQTYKLFRECKIVPCVSSPSAKPVANLVSPSYCQLTGYDLVVIVTEEGSQPPIPVPGAAVRVVGPSPSGEFATTFTDETVPTRGQAKFLDLESGSYQVTASKGGFEETSVKIVHPNVPLQSASFVGEATLASLLGVPGPVLLQLRSSKQPSITSFFAMDKSKGQNGVLVGPTTKVKWEDVRFHWVLEGGFEFIRLILTVRHKGTGHEFFSKKIRDKLDPAIGPLESPGSQNTDTLPPTPFGVIECELEMKTQSGSHVHTKKIPQLKLVEMLAICNQNDDPLFGAQTFVVGERVQLRIRTKPDHLPLTDIKWTIPGRQIRNYDIDWDLDTSKAEKSQVTTHGRVEKFTPTHLKSDIIDFIWTEGLVSGDVQVTVQQGGVPMNARLAVRVLAPTMIDYTSTTKGIKVGKLASPRVNLGSYCQGQGECMALVGDTASPLPGDQVAGINYRASVQAPSGVAGRLGYIQMLNTHAVGYKKDTAPQVLFSSGGQFVLDDHWQKANGGSNPDNFFYPRNNGVLTNPISQNSTVSSFREDSPSQGLDGKEFTEVSRADQFRTYLMFQSNRPNSVPIALGRLEWHWKCTAQFSGGRWNAKKNSDDYTTNPRGQNFAHLPIAERLPEWNKGITNL